MKNIYCDSKMAQMIKALDDNLKNLSSIPRTHEIGDN